MDSKDQWEKICSLKFDEVIKEVRETKSSVQKLNDKIFVGNGKPSFDIQIDRLNIFKKVCCWFIAAVMVVSLSLTAKLIYNSIIS